MKHLNLEKCQEEFKAETKRIEIKKGFWFLNVAFIIGVIGITCFLAFYFRAFEKWDKARILRVEGTSSPYSKIITYEVEGVEYSKKMGFIPPSKAPPVGNYVANQEGESYYTNARYVYYLVSNPSYCNDDEHKMVVIIVSVFDGMLLMFVIGRIIYYFTKGKRRIEADVKGEGRNKRNNRIIG